jgi:hypothetical protein
MMPLVFMTLAKWEGSHGVQVWTGSEGTRVVLTHPNTRGMKCHDSIHRHGLGARLLTLLAEPATGSGPDHVVQFAGDKQDGHGEAAPGSSTDERRIGVCGSGRNLSCGDPHPSRAGGTILLATSEGTIAASLSCPTEGYTAAHLSRVLTA